MGSTIEFNSLFFSDPTTLYANLMVSLLFAQEPVELQALTSSFLQQMANQGHTILPGTSDQTVASQSNNSPTAQDSIYLKHCRKCKAHNIQYRIRKGGYHRCEFETCSCSKCKYIDQRRKDQLMSLQMKKKKKAEETTESKTKEEDEEKKE